MENIKWLFFDIGSTLVDESKCIEQRCRTIASENNIYELEFKNKVLEYAKESFQPVKLAAKYYGTKIPVWNKELEFLYPNVELILSQLSKKYKLGIIANQSLGTKERLDNWGIVKYFNVIVASAEEGCEKPNLKIFETALEKANCKPEEAVMIGDRLDNDIVPAKKIGMKTIWVKQGFAKYQYVKNTDDQPDYIIETISDLLKFDYFVIWKSVELSFLKKSNENSFDLYDANIHFIINNITEFLPFIYSDIVTAKNIKTLGLSIFRTYSYRHNGDYKKIDWFNGISENKIISIFKKNLVNCEKADFLCYWATFILVNCSADIYNEIKLIYREQICENYPNSTIKIIDSFGDKHQEVLNKVKVFCQSILDNESRISKIKDFQVPYSRSLAYYSQKLKENKKMNEDAEKGSIFMKLIDKNEIKYGRRHAYINKNKEMIESGFQEFYFETEMPRAFSSDPALYNICEHLAFRS